MNVAYVMNCPTDSINQCGTSTYNVITLAHRMNFTKFFSVMNNLAFSVEKNCRYIARRILFLLLFDKTLFSHD